MRKIKAFTLIEVMVCIVLTCIVVFFIYTMMLSAHKTYAKLFSISKQRNDIRYFETLLRNSVANADYVAHNVHDGKYILEFGYYTTDSRANGGNRRRIDIYEFSTVSVVEKNATNSQNLLTEDELKGYLNKSATVTYLSYTTSYKKNLLIFINTSKLLQSKTLVLSGVNYFAWAVHDYYEKEPITVDDGSVIYQHHAYFTCSLVFSRTLSDGEINTEAQLYRFAMRNCRCLDSDVIQNKMFFKDYTGY